MKSRKSTTRNGSATQMTRLGREMRDHPVGRILTVDLAAVREHGAETARFGIGDGAGARLLRLHIHHGPSGTTCALHEHGLLLDVHNRAPAMLLQDHRSTRAAERL